jgi:hypothetical protein
VKEKDMKRNGMIKGEKKECGGISINGGGREGRDAWERGEI